MVIITKFFERVIAVSAISGFRIDKELTSLP